MIKNTYKDDYSFTPRLTIRGRVVDDLCYVGDYYVLPFDKKQKTKTAVMNLLFVLSFFALQITSGCLNQDSSRTAWIVFPYFFIFVPMAYMFMGAMEYMRAPLKMQKIQYELGIERMRRSGIGILLFTAVSAILDVIYMILHRGEMHVAREVTYLVIHIVILGLVVLFGKYYDRCFGGIQLESSQSKLE